MPVVRFPADISGDRAAAAASATGENINPLKYREISVRTRRPIVGSGSGPKPTLSTPSPPPPSCTARSTLSPLSFRVRAHRCREPLQRDTEGERKRERMSRSTKRNETPRGAAPRGTKGAVECERQPPFFLVTIICRYQINAGVERPAGRFGRSGRAALRTRQ